MLPRGLSKVHYFLKVVMLVKNIFFYHQIQHVFWWEFLEFWWKYILVKKSFASNGTQLLYTKDSISNNGGNKLTYN